MPDVFWPPTVPVNQLREREDSGLRLAALRLPLVLKLIGANVAIIAVFVLTLSLFGVRVSTGLGTLALGAVVMHAGMVIIALRPIRELESVARRVFDGDIAARVAPSIVADGRIQQVGVSFNTLLDSLEADRARMRRLARDVVEGSDREHAALARELHDTTAQRAAGLFLQLAAAARDARDPSLAARLEAARDAAAGIVEEIRELSFTVHSTVLDDLGLEAALRWLARHAAKGTAIEFEVDTTLEGRRLPLQTESALFRVAREAMFNAARHASPRRVFVSVAPSASQIVLRVRDDGLGFDVTAAMNDASGRRGLAVMRERLAVVDGALHVESSADRGTTVTATVPIR